MLQNKLLYREIIAAAECWVKYTRLVFQTFLTETLSLYSGFNHQVKYKPYCSCTAKTTICKYFTSGFFLTHLERVSCFIIWKSSTWYTVHLTNLLTYVQNKSHVNFSIMNISYITGLDSTLGHIRGS